MEERVKDIEKVEHKVENEDEMSKNKTDNHRKRKIQKKKIHLHDLCEKELTNTVKLKQNK